MENRVISIGRLGAIVLVLSFCSGCKPLSDFFKKKNTESGTVEVKKEEITSKKTGQGTVLLTIDSKDVLYESDFNKHLEQMLKMNPYFRGSKPDALPAALKRKFFDELIKQEIILSWANKNNFEDDAEFQKSFEEMKKLVKRSLLIQRFEAKIFEDIKVSDSEIKDYFEKNKSKFVKSPGGVKVAGIKFTSTEKANAFYDKVKEKVSDFVKLAKKENEDDFQDFGLITKEQKGFVPSDIPEKLKEKALSTTKTPVVEKVKVGKKTWIILVSDKQDAKYLTIAEIKSQLESMLKENKFRSILDEQVKKLEKEFTIDRNYDFFKEKEVTTISADKKTGKIPVSAA
ncbi:peptidyl-prolyl cis-trans isomerase [Candidatus Dependentiae bacterium]